MCTFPQMDLCVCVHCQLQLCGICMCFRDIDGSYTGKDSLVSITYGNCRAVLPATAACSLRMTR